MLFRSQSTPSARFTPTPVGAALQAGQSAASSPFGRRFAVAGLSEAGSRNLAAGLGGGQALADIDGDGRLELIVASVAGQRVYGQEQGGQWVERTAGSGLESTAPADVPVGIVSADFDNDGSADLFVLRDRGSSLYRNDGAGHFSDVTSAAHVPTYPALPGAAAFVDVDHDGDVDLLIAGLADLAATRQQGGGERAFPEEFAPAPLQLLRNNGDGTFSDITTDARLDARGHAVAIVPTDFDNRRDMDLLVVYADTPPVLYGNRRDRTFRDVATE